MPFILAILAALLSVPVLGGPTNAHARVRLQPVGRVLLVSVVDAGMDASVAKADRVRQPALPPMRPVAAAASNVVSAAALVARLLGADSLMPETAQVVPGVTVADNPVPVSAPLILASGSGTLVVTYRYVFAFDDLDLLCPELAGKRAADDSYFGIRAKRIVDLARAGKLDEAKAEAGRYAADWGLYRERGGHR